MLCLAAWSSAPEKMFPSESSAQERAADGGSLQGQLEVSVIPPLSARIVEMVS